MKLGIPWEPEDEVTTVSGLVTESLERIPLAGDSIEWQGYEIRVVRADRKRANVLRITKLETDQVQ